MKNIKSWTLFNERKLNYNFFIEKEDEDRYNITAKENTNLLGTVVLELMFNGEWWFKDVIDNEVFDDIFDDQPFAVIENIRVEKNYVGQGIGKLLMGKAEEIIKKDGIKQIVLNASPMDNKTPEELASWYSKLGYTILKKQKKNIIMYKKI